MTRVIGYCEVGRHIRYVTVTSAALSKAAATGGMVVGVCDSCQKEEEERRAEQKRRST
jgi:hypothetical protein